MASEDKKTTATATKEVVFGDAILSKVSLLCDSGPDLLDCVVKAT